MTEELFYIKSYDELVGNKSLLENCDISIKNINNGEIVLLYGHSGVGKTITVKLLTENYFNEVLWIDTSLCDNGNDILDRIIKFHKWKDIIKTFSDFKISDIQNTSIQNTSIQKKSKVIVIDELESFIKIDRSILNTINNDYCNKYSGTFIPIIFISHIETANKLGNIKDFINIQINIPRINDIDMFLFFKKRLPARKIKLDTLMNICESANGNINIAIKSVIGIFNTKNKKKVTKAFLNDNYKAEEQKPFQEIFNCDDNNTIPNLLFQDTWMNPLKVHENIVKILDDKTYITFLKNYINFEIISYKLKDTVFEYTTSIYYLSYIIVYCIYLQENKKKLDNMDFSKMLSYISTKKKFKKMIINRCPNNYPIDDIGYYWLYSENQRNK
jgi:hypothetical protein